jgi:predicted regulator of Ras-like GTPase activity (Roadblock/LC7/MglB family)
MGPHKDSRQTAHEGFEGSVAGLGLADVIELSANNRFSGCVSVRHDFATGAIFFRDGEVIHAEQDGIRGEEAFYAILGWPGGTFSVDPNVATTSRTIQRSWKFLLMEAHRLKDERRRSVPATPSSLPAAAPGGGAGSTMQRIRQVPGVAYAILLGKDGRRVGDDSFEAETLEGQTAYLALLGKKLGEIFQLGDPLVATVRGEQQHLLLMASKTHDVSVLVRGDEQPGAVEAEIRKVVTAPR